MFATQSEFPNKVFQFPQLNCSFANKTFAGGASTHFFIKATKPGDRILKVRAEIVRNRKRFDEVERSLKVEHEGLTEYQNNAFLIDLREKSHFSYAFDIDIDENALKNSIKISSSAIGDLIGPALSSTEDLM